MSVVDTSRDFVRALARGLSVIESFQGAERPLSLSDLAVRTKLSRGTVRRALLTLESLGYVSEDHGQFTLTPRALRLGYSYLSSQPIWTLTRPIVEEVFAKTGETTSLSVLDDGMIVYLIRITAPRLLHDKLSIGSRLPAYPASMGRVLLAGLTDSELDSYLEKTELRAITPYTVVDPKRVRALVQQARESGYAVNDQEMELGLRSIAVPIKGPDGSVSAAINIGCSSARTSYAEMEMNFLPILRDAASRIGDILAYAGLRAGQAQKYATGR